MSDVNDHLSNAKFVGKSPQDDIRNLSYLCKCIYKTKEGKMLFDELKRIYMDVGIYTYGQGDKLIYFREGQRQLIKYLFDLIEMEEITNG